MEVGGITLFPFIFIRGEGNERIIRHESIHITQYAETLVLGFLLIYVWDFLYAFAKYTPGLILPWHKDNYPTYARNKKADVDRIVRIMVFLHDPAPGHQLWIEDKFCTGPIGSWFSWHGATKHMAANLGEIDRYVIQITGWV